MRAHLDSPNVHFLQKRKKIKKKQIKKDYELTKCQVIKEIGEASLSLSLSYNFL